jgi:pilus assembly protein CpaB
MKLSRINLQIVVIAIFSLLIGIAVYSYTSGVEARVKKEYSTQTLYIATRQIPAGTSVSSLVSTGSIEARQFPISASPSNAISSINQIDGNLVARYTIQPGQILLNDSFAIGTNQTGSLVIPDGKVAVTLSVETPAKVGNFLQPGSKVSIYGTGEVSDSNTVQTQVLLQEVLILAIGNQVLSTSGIVSDSNANLVTVAVTPSQAKTLIHASKNLTLYFSLLGARVQPDLSSPISNASVFNR